MVGILAFACSGLRLDMISGGLGGLLHGLWVVCFDVAVLVVLLCRGFVLLCGVCWFGCRLVCVVWGCWFWVCCWISGLVFWYLVVGLLLCVDLMCWLFCVDWWLVGLDFAGLLMWYLNCWFALA